MRLARAAIGLAAVGAGVLVARMMMKSEADTAEHDHNPPEPSELIGYSPSRKSARDSAQVLRDSDA